MATKAYEGDIDYEHTGQKDMARPEGVSVFLLQGPELPSLSTIDIWDQSIPSSNNPGLHPSDTISISLGVRTKNVFRKYPISPGGLTRILTKATI